MLLNLTRKSGEDERVRRPDYRVLLEVNGEEYEASLWINDEVGGVPVNMSGQITTKGAKP